MMIEWQVQRAHDTMRKLQTAWTDECKMDSQYNAGSICQKWLLDGADSTTARWAHNCGKVKRLSLPNLRQPKERLTEGQEGLIDTRPAQSECKIDITEYNRAKRPNARWFQEQCSLETSKIVSRWFKMFNIIIIMQEYMSGRWSQAPTRWLITAQDRNKINTRWTAWSQCRCSIRVLLPQDADTVDITTWLEPVELELDVRARWSRHEHGLRRNEPKLTIATILKTRSTNRKRHWFPLPWPYTPFPAWITWFSPKLHRCWNFDLVWMLTHFVTLSSQDNTNQLIYVNPHLMSLTFLPLTLNRGTTYSTSWRTTRYQGLPAGLRQLLLFSCFRFNARFVTPHTRKHRRAHQTSTKHKRIATLPNMQFDFILTDQGIFKDWKNYPLNGSHQENLPIKDITMLSGYFIHQSYILWIREGERWREQDNSFKRYFIHQEVLKSSNKQILCLNRHWCSFAATLRKDAVQRSTDRTWQARQSKLPSSSFIKSNRSCKILQIGSVLSNIRETSRESLQTQYLNIV